MYINYDEYELLELFCSDPNVIDKDAGIFLYDTKDKFGFKFTLYFSIYDRQVAIRLSHNDLINPIFDIALTDVEKIEADSEKLSIYRKSHNLKVVVYFKPNFTLAIELP